MSEQVNQPKANPLEEYRQKILSGEIQPPEKGKILNPREKFDLKFAEATSSGKPVSRKLAIDAHCFDCQGGDADKGWKWRIANCECAATCSLYPLRPYQKILFGKPMPLGMARELGYSDDQIEALKKQHDDCGGATDDDDIVESDDDSE